MNILRQPPFPITLTYDGLEDATDYIVEVYDSHSALEESFEVVSDGSGTIEIELPKDFEKYDDTYSLYVYTVNADVADETVITDNLYIYRPYINPQSLAETEEEIEEYTNYERLARQIIDNMTGGFYYTKMTLETTGLGADYLPIPARINKVNYIYENNTLIYDRFDSEAVQNTYYVTPDYTAVTMAVGEQYNRSESRPVRLPLANSDSFTPYDTNLDTASTITKNFSAALFPNGYDYVVYGEVGWPVVPQDIKDAAKMLINDIKCNNLAYVNRYITEYSTDQFRLKYGEMSQAGTGNMLVDKILSAYAIPVKRIGVL